MAKKATPQKRGQSAKKEKRTSSAKKKKGASSAKKQKGASSAKKQKGASSAKKKKGASSAKKKATSKSSTTAEEKDDATPETAVLCTLNEIHSRLEEMYKSKDEKESSLDTMMKFIKSCDCINYEHDTLKSEKTQEALIKIWEMGEEATSRKDGIICRKKKGRRRKETPNETKAYGMLLQLYLGGLEGKLDDRTQKEAAKVIDAVAAEEDGGLQRFKRKAYAFLSGIWSVTKTGASIVRKFVFENPRIALTTICGMLLVSVLGVDRFAQLISALLDLIKLIYSGVSGILSSIRDLFSGTTQQAKEAMSKIAKARASEQQLEALQAVVRSDPKDKAAIMTALNTTNEYAKQVHETNRLNAKVAIKNNYDANMGTANVAVVAPLAFQAVTYGLAVFAPQIGVPLAMVNNAIKVVSMTNAAVSFSGMAYGWSTQRSHDVAVQGM